MPHCDVSLTFALSRNSIQPSPATSLLSPRVPKSLQRMLLSAELCEGTFTNSSVLPARLQGLLWTRAGDDKERRTRWRHWTGALGWILGSGPVPPPTACPRALPTLCRLTSVK